MVRWRLILATVSLLAAIGSPAQSQDRSPQFRLPVQCEFPHECYVQSYVDLEPGPAAVDHACGINTYDGHRGTDFRLRSLDLMDRGVPVVAAAAGTVLRIRDGVRDVHMKLFGKKLAFRRGAGNHVLIDHGGGWRTLYGHMRRNSIAVKPGDRVAAGHRIGLVGMSGLTEFPHLHFEAAHNGAVVDPFAGPAASARCEKKAEPLWTKDAAETLQYRKYFLIAAGFSDVPLSREALLYGLHVRDRLPRNAPNIVFHVDFAGLRTGDSSLLRIIDPSGRVFSESQAVSEKDAPVRFQFVGKKIANRPAWPPGTYRGEFLLFRAEGERRIELIRHAVELQVE